MSVTVSFGGEHPLSVTAIEMSGYHRPLGGEVANLTIVADRSEFFAEWLACPPLGVTCDVTYGGLAIMSGYLYGVRFDAGKVELRVEG